MSKKQKEEFLRQEADHWYKRNKQTLAPGREDPVLTALAGQNFMPGVKSVLEVGCSNGWRLATLKRNKPELECYGIEPSSEAVAAAEPELNLQVGTADSLPFEDKKFDLVIFGFCLYLCDPDDLFKIAMEADRVLNNKGHVVIYDFYSPSPYRNPYSYKDGMYSFKMDYSRMLLWHPYYRMASHTRHTHGSTDSNNPDDFVTVTILQKDMDYAFIDNPYK